MQTEPTKPSLGGTRQGARRKSAYGEPTATLWVLQSAASLVVGYLDELKRSPQAPSNPAVSRPIAAQRETTITPPPGRRVRAGKPTSGDDNQEDPVNLGKHPVRNPSSTFIKKVAGWSVRDASTTGGDELVVDRDAAPEGGWIGVADVDSELSIKRLKRTTTGWLLRARTQTSLTSRLAIRVN